MLSAGILASGRHAFHRLIAVAGDATVCGDTHSRGPEGALLRSINDFQ